MDRCKEAYEYHRQGYNCAQSVAAVFADLAGLAPEQLLATAGGFGGGVGGSHAELCGAVSGGVMALGLLHPHTDGANSAAKREIAGLAKEFRDRFAAKFGPTRCGELLAIRPGVTDETPAAARLGITAHCDVMIVTAVELVEELLGDRAQ